MHPRSLTRWLTAGALAGLGCTGPAAFRAEYPVPAHLVTHAPATPAAPVQPVSHTEPAAPVAAVPKEIPITLDSVLRLAERHNPRLGLARERLHESQLTMDQGSVGWIPNVYAGFSYYRHEGGIQQFDGTITHSSTGAVYPALSIASELDFREGVFTLIELERRIWQNRAELSQVNNEVLMEAGLTYVDLLTARRGEALSREMQKHERKLLAHVENLLRGELGYAALAEAIKASLSNHDQMASKLRHAGDSASAKLVYLLGLPPGTCLTPIDVLAPIELVDVSPPPCDLIAKSYAHGPGVRELEGVLDTVARALEKTDTYHNLLPSVQANLAQGPFGAGPGATLAWDNRFDFGLQVRWNLTSLCQTESKRNLIRSKQAQVMYTLDEARNKLALGVTDSRDSIFAGREQIGLAGGQIRHAGESYDLSQKRMEAILTASGPGEVLQTIRGLEQAHFNHLQAIQEHNKAQVRLMMLLGGGPPAAASAVLGAPIPTLPEPRRVEN